MNAAFAAAVASSRARFRRMCAWAGQMRLSGGDTPATCNRMQHQHPTSWQAGTVGTAAACSSGSGSAAQELSALSGLSASSTGCWLYGGHVFRCSTLDRPVELTCRVPQMTRACRVALHAMEEDLGIGCCSEGFQQSDGCCLQGAGQPQGAS